MSSRRSLYRTNRSHTSLYGPRTDTSVTHWQLDFVTINTTRDEDAPSDTPQKTNSFQVKAWTQVSEDSFQHLDDGVENDTLPFVKHSHLDTALAPESREVSEAPADAKSEAQSLSFFPTDSAPSRVSDSGTPSAVTGPVTPAEGVSGDAGTSASTSTEASGASTANGTAAATPVPEAASVPEATSVANEQPAASEQPAAGEQPAAESGEEKSSVTADGETKPELADDAAAPSNGAESKSEDADVSMPDVA